MGLKPFVDEKDPAVRITRAEKAIEKLKRRVVLRQDLAIRYDVLNVGSGLRVDTSAALTPLVVGAGITLGAGTPDGGEARLTLDADSGGHPQAILGPLHMCELVLDPGLVGSFYSISDGSAGPNMLRVNVDGNIFMPLLPTVDPGTGLGGLWVDGSNFVRYST